MEVNLVMFKPNGRRKDFPLVNENTVIGRAEDCDLRIPLLSVSRRHCEITLSDNGATVRDLASSNGTYVNNQRANEADLEAGDRLVIGPIVFTVQIDGRPEEIQPVKTRGQVLAEGSHGGGEEVDLDAEIAAGLEDSGAEESGLDETSVTTEHPEIEPSEAEEIVLSEAEGQAEEDDPLSALEAMASQNEEEDDAKESD